MRKAKIFIINGIILTISSFAIRAIGLIFNIFIANQVGQEAIGNFSLVMSVYLFFITFACSGIGLASTCIISEQLEKTSRESCVKVAKTCMVFACSFGLIASLVLSILAPTISSNWLHHKVSKASIYLIALVLPFISVSSVISSYFTSIGKSYKNALVQFFEVLSKIIATVFLLQNQNKNVVTVCYYLVLGDVISEFVSFLLKYYMFYFERKKFDLKLSYTKKVGKQILKISFPIAVTSYIRSGLSSLQQFLIPMRLQVYGLSYSLATAKYGLINGMAMPVIMFANLFTTSFSSLLFPEYARLLAGKNFGRMKTVCNKIFKITFNFSFLVAGVLLFFANEISFAVYNNLEIATYLRLLAPCVVFMYVDNIIDNILKGMQAQFHVMCVNICDLAIIIFNIFFLVPIYGITGYIISIIISEVFNFICSFMLLKKKLKVEFDFWNFLIKPFLLIFPCFVLCSIIPFEFENIFINIGFKIIVFTSFYYLFLSRI